MLQASAAQGRELQATLGLEHLNVEQRLQILGPLFHPVSHMHP